MSRNYGTKKAELMQKMIRDYRETLKPDQPLESKQCADWMLKHGWRPPPPRTPRELVARDVGRTLRAEYRRDEVGGFPYRANVAYRITTQEGEQLTFWVDPDRAPKKQVHTALTQRRDQVFGDVMGMANDLEHFNRVRGFTDGPIAMTFDFNNDIEEARALRKTKPEPTPDDSEDDDEKL